MTRFEHSGIAHQHTTAMVSNRTLQAAALLFLVAFVVRTAVWFSAGTAEPFVQVEVVQTAMSFAAHNTLGDPYILPTGATAHVTPAFPFLLGLVYKCFPDPRVGETVKNLVTIGISSLQYALLPVLAVLLRIGWRTGFAAGLAGAVLPFAYLECSGNFEAPLVGLSLVGLCIASLAGNAWHRMSPARSAVLGGIWGLAALVSAQLVMVGFVYELASRIRNKSPFRVKATAIGAFVAGMVMAMLPWACRNYLELGFPFVSRSNAGLELYISNNDLASASMDENMRRGLLSQHHPHGSKQEAQLVQQLGEAGYNRLKEHQVREWIAEHPRKFLALTIDRFRIFWFVDERSDNARRYCTSLLLLGIAGLFVLWRLRPPAAALLTVILIVYPLPHYLIQTGMRYRYPLNSILLLLSSVLVSSVWARLRTAVPATLENLHHLPEMTT